MVPDTAKCPKCGGEGWLDVSGKHECVKCGHTFTVSIDPLASKFAPGGLTYADYKEALAGERWAIKDYKDMEAKAKTEKERAGIKHIRMEEEEHKDELLKLMDDPGIKPHKEAPPDDDRCWGCGHRMRWGMHGWTCPHCDQWPPKNDFHAPGDIYIGLNDAADNPSVPARLRDGYKPGLTQIYFFPATMAEVQLGKRTPSLKEIKEHYTFIGEVAERDIDRVFEMMEVENYSPNGEASTFLGSKFASHTSMSVGDVVRIGERWLIARMTGWTDITNVKEAPELKWDKNNMLFAGAMFLLGALAIQAFRKDSCLNMLVRGEIPPALK